LKANDLIAPMENMLYREKKPTVKPRVKRHANPNLEPESEPEPT